MRWALLEKRVSCAMKHIIAGCKLKLIFLLVAKDNLCLDQFLSLYNINTLTFSITLPSRHIFAAPLASDFLNLANWKGWCKISLFLQKGAMTPMEVCEGLGLYDLKNRIWHIQGSCALKGDGLYEGLDWLASTLKELQASGRLPSGGTLLF